MRDQGRDQGLAQCAVQYAGRGFALSKGRNADARWQRHGIMSIATFDKGDQQCTGGFRSYRPSQTQVRSQSHGGFAWQRRCGRGDGPHLTSW
jgi:hypothetical protein